LPKNVTSEGDLKLIQHPLFFIYAANIDLQIRESGKPYRITSDPMRSTHVKNRASRVELM